MEILQKNNFKVSDWSGGQTTQLFIFPIDSQLQNRDFTIRISTASIQSTFSEFTNFNGYERVILPLNGELKLSHRLMTGEINQDLKAFQLGRFSGDWNTTGSNFPHLQDFNVIFDAQKTSVKLHLLHLKQDEVMRYAFENRSFIWCYSGQLSVNQLVVNKGEAAVSTIPEVVQVQAKSDLTALVVEW